MRASEFVKEQSTIGTVGSTASSPGQVPQVSQTSEPEKEKRSDPNQEQLAKLLMPYGIKEPEDLNNVSSALQKAMQSPGTLNPEQQELLGKLVNPLLKNQGFAMAIKNLSTQKPGTPSQPPAGGQV